MGVISNFKGRFRRGERSSGLTAIEYRPEGIALAHVEMRFGKPAVSQCLFLPGDGPGLGEDGLKQMVKSLGLSNSRCVLVLSPSDYRLVPVETPDVPEHEIKGAVRWKLADLIDFPADQAAIDVFPMPSDALRGGARSVFVVAAPRDDVRVKLEHLKTSGIEATCIDVSHLAFRNLAERFGEPGSATAVLVATLRGSHLMIIRDGNIYVARPVNFTTAILEREGNQREIALSQLVGELKRSLDYYEIQLRQEPVAGLAVAPLDRDPTALLDYLSNNLGTEVFPVNIPDVVPCDSALPDSIQAHCAGAIGGALRKGGVA